MVKKVFFRLLIVLVIFLCPGMSAHAGSIVLDGEGAERALSSEAYLSDEGLQKVEIRLRPLGGALKRTSHVVIRNRLTGLQYMIDIGAEEESVSFSLPKGSYVLSDIFLDGDFKASHMYLSDRELYEIREEPVTVDVSYKGLKEGMEEYLSSDIEVKAKEPKGALEAAEEPETAVWFGGEEIKEQEGYLTVIARSEHITDKEIIVALENEYGFRYLACLTDENTYTEMLFLPPGTYTLGPIVSGIGEELNASYRGDKELIEIKENEGEILEILYGGAGNKTIPEIKETEKEVDRAEEESSKRKNSVFIIVFLSTISFGMLGAFVLKRRKDGRPEA